MTASNSAHTCFALDQIFVALDGRVLPCCLAHHPLGTVADDFRAMLERKVSCNEDIVQRNDASACWAGCPSRLATAARPDPRVVRKVVFYTNTFCPLQCQYCSLAYDGDAAEWEHDEGLPDRGRSIRPGPHSGPIWEHRGPDGRKIRPVHSRANDNPSFLALIEKMIPVARERGWWFEFSGGDSAYHPEFAAVLERTMAAGITVSYLSSGVIPEAVEEQVLAGIASGLVWITISTDSTTASTWSVIKRRPERLHERLHAFVRRSATVERAPRTAIKFIVMRENLAELPAFIPTYRALGVRRFVLSAYRRQPVHFIPPASEADMRFALKTTIEAFARESLPAEAELILIGFEDLSPRTSFNQRQAAEFARELAAVGSGATANPL